MAGTEPGKSPVQLADRVQMPDKRRQAAGKDTGSSFRSDRGDVPYVERRPNYSSSGSSVVPYVERRPNYSSSGSSVVPYVERRPNYSSSGSSVVPYVERRPNYSSSGSSVVPWGHVESRLLNVSPSVSNAFSGFIPESSQVSYRGIIEPSGGIIEPSGGTPKVTIPVAEDIIFPKVNEM